MPATGPAEAPIEAYTILYDREGEPQSAIVSVLPDAASRAVASTTDAATMAELGGDPRGRTVKLDGRSGFGFA